MVFVTPLVRTVSLPSVVVWVFLSLVLIFSHGKDGAPEPVPLIAAGVFNLVLALPVLVSVIKGYRLTVADDRVVAHGVVNRVYPYASIRSVEVVGAHARWAQTRTCLCFHLTDGSSYTFKNFNGSLDPGSTSAANVVRAKELIDQRIAGLQRSGSMRVPPPPPLSRAGPASAQPDEPDGGPPSRSASIGVDGPIPRWRPTSGGPD